MNPAQPSEVPLERRVALPATTELDRFDPRRYAGTMFLTKSGSMYQIWQHGSKCAISGRSGEAGEHIAAEGAEIHYAAGLPLAPVEVARVLRDVNSNGPVSYIQSVQDLERQLRPHRELVTEGLHLMVYCEKEGIPYLIITSPIAEKKPER
jgi:hypothetical protein